ncbi:MAG: hypothetical protein R3C01_14880 [Planctomycetaceae bacterium]
MSGQIVKRALFVSYAFPPVGGVGVHRVTKFVKYLPEFGWRCSVLTVDNPSVPLFDESLCRDIPPSTIIRRAKTLEPSYAAKNSVSASASGASKGGMFSRLAKGVVRKIANTVLQPDSQILWRRDALKEGMRLLNEIPHDVIIATAPPFSSLLLGATLAKKSGLPLVLDYRDEWGISNAYWENKGQGLISNWIQTRMQNHALKAARVLLATTPSSAAAVGELAAAAGSTAVPRSIYNGFDPDDFAGWETQSRAKVDYGNGTNRYRMAFIGTLWALNSIEPFVEGITQLARSAPQLVEQLELVFAGRRTAEQEAMVDRLQGLPCAVVRLPFVDHDAAVHLMRSADGLLLLNSDFPHTHRIIGAKTYEYMAARRPMFVVAPKGDLWDVVVNLPGTTLCEPSQIGQISERLGLVLERHRCGSNDDDAIWDIARFERRNLTEELADLLDELVTSSLTTPKVALC